LKEGIDPKRFEALSGVPLQAHRIANLIEHGMIEQSADGRIRVTQQGFPVLDAIVADLAA
jgi:oxygen-independent coproporphyrinogen-3 oxidase